METSIHLERVRGVEISRETFDLLKKKIKLNSFGSVFRGIETKQKNHSFYRRQPVK